MINFKVEVYNSKENKYVDYTPFAVFPLKVANLLDEQLDEMNLTLKNMRVEYFQPFTEFKITILNKPECLLTSEQISQIKAKKEIGVYYIPDDEVTGKLAETYSITMVVANDRAIEVPVGSKRYNHEVYLIEQTKILERFISDSLTFSNPLGKGFLEDVKNVIPEQINLYGYSDIRDYFLNFYQSPVEAGATLRILSLAEISKKYIDYWKSTGTRSHFEPSVTTLDGKGQMIRSNIQVTVGDETTTYTPDTIYTSYNISVSNPIIIQYQFRIYFTIEGGLGNSSYEMFNFKYILSAVTNKLPLKKWTITSVINRILDLIEPLEASSYLGNTDSLEQLQPRFYLNEDQAEKYDKIIAPEFSFTRATLREILQQIGGFGAVHAEPRISKRDGERYEIIFDEYGSNEYSNISKEAYVNATFGTDINQYCTALDSSADNLTNTLDWAQGVIVEPFMYGERSLRTEQTTARLAEDNSTFIATQLPIQTLNKLEWYDGEKYYDITAYVFEATDYSTTLSSFQGTYPYSKAYALYYTYGQKNIKGLFFKAEHAVSPIFHNYSIINILRAVTGESDLEFTGKELMQLQFNVTYKPIYSARVRTHKQIVLDGTPSVLAYNQGANAIESNYYGTHLRAVVERLGTVEKTYTYQLAFLSQIPKVGRKFDDNYYISNVTYEVLPFSIKCTIALSKHFNRLSTYVGINSQKRMWEISERQTQQRQSIFTSYIVASLTNNTNDANASRSLAEPAKLLLNLTDYQRRVTNAIVRTSDINNKSIREYLLSLPVVSSVFGNAMTFTFAFEDNYSAGQKLIEVDGDKTNLDNVTGMWGDYVPYTDYYGRAYYIDYGLFRGYDDEIPYNDANELPQVNNTVEELSYGACLLGARYLYRKDNREIPQITHEIAVVTDNSSIVIGPALCSNCSAVNVSPKNYAMYLLRNRINLIDGKIDISSENADEVPMYQYVEITSNSIQITIQVDETYKAWALVTDNSTTQLQVEDEQGNAIIQTIQEGGELLIGRNINSNKEVNETIYLTYKRKIN